MTARWPALPFHVGGAVADDQRFVNRAILLETLRALIADPNRAGFVLRGPRRSGKSSVLERLERLVRHEVRVVRLDIFAILGEAHGWPVGTVTPSVLRVLVEALKLDLPPHLRELMAPSLFDVQEFRRRVLPELLDADTRRLVVLFDEMEVAEARDEKAPGELALALLPLPGEQRVPPFLGIVWGRPFGRGLARDIPNRFKDYHRVAIDRFAPADVQVMLEQPLTGAYAWAPGALARAWALTAGHPLFVAALGAGVHAGRRAGTGSPVSAEEVDAGVARALVHAESWEDAWRQLRPLQKLFLRAVAEAGQADISQVADIVRGWGAPYDADSFGPLTQGLVEDDILARSPMGLRFDVELMRRWVLTIEPGRILGTPEDPRDGASAAAVREERRGRELYVAGRLEEAARAFEAALDLDEMRWAAAVSLGQILLQQGKPMDAARRLRRPSQTTEVVKVRARALEASLRLAMALHEDVTPWAEELRIVDPLHQDAPEAAALFAELDVDTWWRITLAERQEPSEQVTDRLILDPGGPRIPSALRRISRALEAAREGQREGASFDRIVQEVAPYLLHRAEPFTHVLTDPAEAQQLAAAWEECYVATTAWLARLATGPADLGTSVLPSTLLHLLDSRRARTSLGEPMRRLASALATASRVAELACTDVVLVEGAMNLLDHLPHDLPSGEGPRRLREALERALSMAHAGTATALAAALRSLPALGVRALQTLADDGLGISFKRDIVFMLEHLFHRLELDPECVGMAVAEEESAWTTWQSVLGLLRRAAPAEVAALDTSIRNVRTQSAAVERPNPSLAHGWLEAGDIQAVLGEAYRVGNAVPYRIFGVPPGYVRAWNVDRLGRRLLVRAYRVDDGEPSVQRFLAHLWDNERRLLATLATRWEGRALPRMYVSRFDPSGTTLLLVTDHIGPTTLRDLLDSGEIARVRATSSVMLWQHLQGVIEALASLHRAGYLHRAVRPEHVQVDSEAGSNRGRQWLRLANFEWSVYMYSIARAQPLTSQRFDRYMAPERLALRNADSASGDIGEGTVTDIFALGLLLFECLVGPLHPEECGPLPASYGTEEHRDWIVKLLEQADRAVVDRRLLTDEVFLLKDLLRPDPSRRCSDLDSVLDRVARLTRQGIAVDVQHATNPLQLVTTLELGTRESIARFITDVTGLDFPDREHVTLWIEKQMLGASIRPNRRVGAPLLVGCEQISFTIEPFRFHDQIHHHIGWLKVATEHDGPAGGELGRLETRVQVHNYRRELALAPLLTSAESWAPWFQVVDRLHEGLTIDERAFLDRIRWSIELERRSWGRQVLPYRLVEYRPGIRPGDPDVAIIADRADPRRDPSEADKEEEETYRLDALMAQSIDRENTLFELGVSSDPTTHFDPGKRWIQTKSNEDNGFITMVRFRREGAGDPPKTGWVRPYSLAGHRTLYQRRKDVLADVEHDPFLVRALLTPREVFDDLNLPPTRLFDRNLDADKQAVALAIQNRQPFFVVRGPPGTGKTTLATEVILRTLYEDKSSRILVVAQAHDPLNNLLERVQESIEKLRKQGLGLHPSSVRLSSEERLDESRYGKEGVRVVRQYHPSRVADRLMQEASRWRPGDDDIAHPAALAAWQRLAGTQALHGMSRSLERRLVNSANLVYATANDRRLAAMRPGSFDLVIYEEAAKAYPAEILGPLRLARRWLLIGDSRQLPPFGLHDIESCLDDDVARFRQERRLDRPVGGELKGIDPLTILGTVPPLRDPWSVITEEMRGLLRFFEFLYKRAARVPLGPALPGGIDGSVAQISGLTGMLTTQWRMHPIIGDFVSQCFYEGGIRNARPKDLVLWRRHGLEWPAEIRNQSIVWLDVPSVEDQALATERPGFGGGYENGFEARAIFGFARELFSASPSLTFAILSPYRAQIKALGQIAKDYEIRMGDALHAHVHTADSFQGKQADIVLVSLVRNNTKPTLRGSLGFMHEPERINVIFSRAERLLVLVGCLRHFRRHRDTAMYTVAAKIEELAGQKDSGVAIVPAANFIEDKFWRDLERFHATRPRTDQRATRREGP